MLLFMESSSTYLTWQIFMPDAFPDTIPKEIRSPLETEAGVFLLGECVNPYSMAPPSSIIAFQIQMLTQIVNCGIYMCKATADYG